jgi:thiamine-phosphate pyrophosphorylase
MKISFRLYLITDRRQMKPPFYGGVEDALRAGVKAIQLREKDLTIKEISDMASKLKKLTKKYGAMLFINDRADVALAVDADGVHLGRQGIPVKAVKKIAGRRLLIGVSTHSVKEALEADAEGADFITLGPVFKTPSKLRYGPPIGLSPIKEAGERLKIPVFAIGGIKPGNLKRTMDAGASGVALISHIVSSKDIFQTTERFMGMLK